MSRWQTRAWCWRRATGSTAPAGAPATPVERAGREPHQFTPALRAVTMVTPVANMPSALRNSGRKAGRQCQGGGGAGAVHKVRARDPASKGMELLWSATCARAAQATRHSFLYGVASDFLYHGLRPHGADAARRRRRLPDLCPLRRCWPAQATAPWRGTCPVMGTARPLSPTPSKAWRKAAWHSSRPAVRPGHPGGTRHGRHAGPGSGRAPRRGGEPPVLCGRWPGAMPRPCRTGWPCAKGR